MTRNRSHQLFRIKLCVTMLGVTPASADAAERDAKARAAVIEAVSRCRTVVNTIDRLRCFDQASASLDEAVRSEAVVVVDRELAERERRASFGQRRKASELPTLRDAQGNELATLEGVVEAANAAGDGNWRFILKDRSVWQQTDGLRFAVEPRTGQKVTIKRAALGTYKLSVNGQPGVRVRRIG